MNTKLFLLTLLTVVYIKSYSQLQNDSLSARLKHTTGTARVDVLNDLSYSLKLDNSNLSMLYAVQAANLSDSLDYVQGGGYARYNLGFQHYLSGDFDQALVELQAAMELADKLEDPLLKKRISEGFALIYEELNAPDKSLRYFQRTYDQALILNDHAGMGLALMGAARLYDKIGQINLALKSNLQALEIFKRSLNLAGIAKVSLDLAWNYVVLDQPDSTSYYFNQAEGIIQEIESGDLRLDLYLDKAEIYADTYIDSSLYYISKAIVLAKRLDREYLRKDLLLRSSELHTQRGEYQLAYEFHNRYNALNDSLMHLATEDLPNNRSDLALNEIIYSEQSRISDGRNTLSILDYAPGRWMIFGFGFVLIVIVGLLAGLGYRYRVHSRSIRKLNALEQELSQLSEELSRKDRMILDLRKGGKDYRSPDALKKAITEKGQHSGRSKPAPAQKSTLDFPVEAIQFFISGEWEKLRKVRERLGVRQQQIEVFVSSGNDFETVNLNEMSGVMEAFYSAPAGDRVAIHHASDPVINILTDKALLLLLISCLLQNAVESIQDTGDVFLDYWSEEEKIVYRIMDTGEGIDGKDLERVFEPFYSTRKSEKHLGLGLSLCREIVRTLKGVLVVKSKLGVGTEVRIEFHYNQDNNGDLSTTL